MFPQIYLDETRQGILIQKWERAEKMEGSKGFMSRTKETKALMRNDVK